MFKYYDKRNNRIIKTEEEIPQWLLDKKTFLLPVEEVLLNVQDIDTPERESGIYELADKVEQVIVTRFHVNTLEEEKACKIRELKNYVYTQLPEVQDQLFVLAGVITGSPADSIKQKVLQAKNYFYAKKAEIEDLSTIDEVKAFNYEDK